MRLPELLQAGGVVAWAREFGGALRRVLGTRQAAGIQVGLVELGTGTTTVVKATSANVGREVLISARNSSAFNANAFALPIQPPGGSFTIQHTAGDPGRVVAWLIV